MNKTREMVAIKRATARVVEWLGKPIAASKFCRVSSTLVSQYANPDHSYVPPMDVCLDFDAACIARGGAPFILREYAGLLGFDLVPREKSVVQQVRSITALSAEIVRDTGEAVPMALDAVSDGRKPTISKSRAVDSKIEVLVDDALELSDEFRSTELTAA